jgi:hypothetical protein
MWRIGRSWLAWSKTARSFALFLGARPTHHFHRTEVKQWLRSDATAPKEGRTNVIDERWRGLSTEIIGRLGFAEEEAARAGEES